MVERECITPQGLLAYIEHGTGPDLLFLHGGIATPKAYRGLFTLLGERFRVIAPTHPGHGRSFTITKSWTTQSYIETYRNFLECCSIKPAFIVGHSLGGMFSLLLAKEYPHVPVVSMSSCGLPIPVTPKEYIHWMSNEAAWLLRKQPDLRTLTETVPAAQTLVYTVVRHPENLAWLSEHIALFDITKDVCNLQNKVLLLWGEHDLIMPCTLGQKLAKCIPHATMRIIPNAGHIFPVSEVQTTYSEIMQFWELTKN